METVTQPWLPERTPEEYITLGKKMEALVESPEWKALVEFATEGPFQSFANLVMRPAEKKMDFARQEHHKGTVYGMQLICTLPTLIIAEAEQARKDRCMEEEDARDRHRRDARRGTIGDDFDLGSQPPESLVP